MRKTGSARGAAAAFAAWAAVAASSALAAEIDGKSNLVCAATDAVLCVESAVCRVGSTRAFELPEFMYVDFKNKVVRARSSDATTVKVQSPILNMHTSERSLVLHGFENDRGWTLSVDRKTERLSVTVTGGESTVVVFGFCTAI